LRQWTPLRLLADAAMDLISTHGLNRAGPGEAGTTHQPKMINNEASVTDTQTA